MYVCICVYLYLYLSLSLDIYIYIYIYTPNIYIYIYGFTIVWIRPHMRRPRRLRAAATVSDVVAEARRARLTSIKGQGIALGSRRP